MKYSKDYRHLNLWDTSVPWVWKGYLYPKDLFEAKYQLWISKYKSVCLKYSNDPTVFIETFNDMDDIYENI